MTLLRRYDVLLVLLVLLVSLRQGGFVGVLPALSMLSPAVDGSGPVVLSVAQQLAWGASVCLFGRTSGRGCVVLAQKYSMYDWACALARVDGCVHVCVCTLFVHVCVCTLMCVRYCVGAC